MSQCWHKNVKSLNHYNKICTISNSLCAGTIIGRHLYGRAI